MDRKAKPANVLLVGPYKSEELRIGQYLSPPLGIYRIASYLQSKGVADVDVIDCNLDGTEKLASMLKSKKYDIIGFSLLHQTMKNDIPLINLAKRETKALLVAGGQGAAFNQEFLFKNSPLDIIVKGFGEFALENIISALGEGNLMESVPGLFVRTERGILDTGAAKRYTQEDFELISLSLDFGMIPYERYWRFMESVYTEKHLRIMKNDQMLRTIRVVTSSHCPMKCRFCSSTNFLDHASGCQQVLMLSPESIIKMLAKAKEAHPSTASFYLCDDDFIQDKERVVRFCGLLNKEPNLSPLTFFCLSRVDHAEEEVLKRMKDAGFRFIIYGVESFSRRVLKDMRKNLKGSITSLIADRTVENTISTGMTPLMNLIIFYPTAKIQDIIETVEHSIGLVEKGARLTVYPYVEFYPGSDMARDRSLEATTSKVDIDGKTVEIPDIILPRDSLLRSLASESVKLSAEIKRNILEKYSWKGVVPHPLNGIALFIAIYSILGKDCKRLLSLADRIMEEAGADEKLCSPQSNNSASSLGTIASGA